MKGTCNFKQIKNTHRHQINKQSQKQYDKDNKIRL